MTTEGFKRKLVAILSADVEGYSRLMDDNEEATVRTLTAYRNAIADLVQQYRGRVVDSTGDNLLAEFASVVDAVNCAVEIQRDLAERNAELPHHRKMEFRIGVNLGDVIEEEGRIYGDGVNIAARVESLSEAGGICISGRAYDQVANKLGLEYENLGEHQVKNISTPIRVYRVLSFPGAAAHRVVKAKKAAGKSWRNAIIAIVAVLVVGAAVAIWHFYFRAPPMEPASIEKMAYPLPDKPSVAVLPFVNMSGDPKQEYISDGISETIITALCKIPEMFVIARTSTSTYKGKSVKIKQVSEELGVRYVLEGSVQKTGDRIRVTAQLIDAISGHHLWANHYDKNIKDFFHLLDEIAKKVAVELQVKLTEGELARGSLKTKNFEAWGYATTAYSLLKRLTKENNAKARELSEKAVKLDPGYGYAWGALGAAHTNDAQLGWSESRDNSFKLAVECTDKSLKLDESLPCSTALKGRLHLLQGQFEKAIAIGEKAISLGPSHDLPYSLLSLTMLYAGRFEESITLVKKAMRLNPSYPAFLISVLARDYYFTERYNEAIEAGKRLLERAQKGGYPPHLAHLGLSATYMELGREEEARAHVVEALGMNPKFSLDHYRKVFIFKDPAHTKRLYIAMRKAGLPDRSPLPLPKKPSIAVLPFTNLSDDPKQEYFSDGMTDDLITDLSKISGLFVIARNSSFTYKGKSIKVQQVGKDLGVRYILEGTVRRAGNDVRINAQLIDASTGHHLWAERYDGKMKAKDIFAFQDNVTGKIVSALKVELSVGERKLVESMETDTIDAYDAFLIGYRLFQSQTVEGMADSIKYFEKAIELDKNYGRAYAMLAFAYFMPGFQEGNILSEKIGLSYPVILLRARHYLQLAMKKPTDVSHQVASGLAIRRRKYEKAIAEAEKALALNPSGSGFNFNMGCVLVYAGRPREAINYFKRALELDPLRPGWPLFYMGVAHFTMGQFDEAVALINRALTHDPKKIMKAILAASYAHLDRYQEARDALNDYLKVFSPQTPDLSTVVNAWAFKELKDLDRFAQGLVKAGLPGRASDYCKISKQNKLTGKEIRNLLFGRTMGGTFLGSQWSVSHDKEGKCTRSGYTGKSWIEGDTLFTQYEILHEDRKFGMEIYRNPGGTAETMNEYCYVCDFAVLPFSVAD